MDFDVKEGDEIYSILTVKDKRISFSYSECPDKVCINTGWIAYPGQSAVCLPNRVMVKIVNPDDLKNDIDVILR
jgi:hypothetical protein